MAALVPPSLRQGTQQPTKTIGHLSARGGHGRQGWDAATVLTDAMVRLLASAASC